MADRPPKYGLSVGGGKKKWTCLPGCVTGDLSAAAFICVHLRFVPSVPRPGDSPPVSEGIPSESSLSQAGKLHELLPSLYSGKCHDGWTDKRAGI